MDRVKDKVAIVTGSARGLGKAQALTLAREGSKVVVTDLLETEGKTVVEEITSQGGEAIFLEQDVTKEQNWKEVIEKTLSQFGRLNVLVNNAGVLLHKAIEDMSLEEWRWLMGVNLDGVFLGTKHAVGAMRKTGGGSIINISSIAGLIGMRAETSAYAASKGAVRLFTKASALEFSKSGCDYNIRVNSVHPGFILTDMLEGIISAETEKTGQKYEEALKNREERAPIGRLGELEDVANAVLFLASDESKYMTGAELVVDGGVTA
jgi:NAD(P)-dependent dehydrogenase (short-subunit alcohol dehydrogenase family)